MAKPNYSFAKRQRELEKKNKKEEKRRNKAEGKDRDDAAPADGDTINEAAPRVDGIV